MRIPCPFFSGLISEVIVGDFTSFVLETNRQRPLTLPNDHSFDSSSGTTAFAWPL